VWNRYGICSNLASLGEPRPLLHMTTITTGPSGVLFLRVRSCLCYQSCASVWMCDCKWLSAHNFVDFCRQTTPTTSGVLRCRSPSRYPPSSLTRQMFPIRDVQAPFTVVEVDLSVGDDHLCCRKLHGSHRSFSLTGTLILSHSVRIQWSRSQYFTSILTTFYVVFISTFLKAWGHGWTLWRVLVQCQNLAQLTTV